MRKKLLATGLFAALFIVGLLFSGNWPYTVAIASVAFTVDSTIDATDVNPGDGMCMTAAGECTLRAAIQETNALSGTDTIILPAGIYTLTIPGGNEDASATGDLDITDSVDIAGAGFATTIVDGNDLDRVLHVISGGPVSITGVTIQNGTVTGNGGGIYAPYFANRLTITSSVIKDNHVTGPGAYDGQGGGIYHNGPITSIDDPSLIIDKTAISGNIADNYTGGVLAGCATVLIVDSTIDSNVNNRTDTCTGGVAQSCSQGKMRIIGSTISNNRAAGCAGIAHSGHMSGGRLVVINSTISGNTALHGTPAISGDNVKLINTSVVNNVGSEGAALRGTFTFANTLIAHNGPQNCDDVGTYTTLGFNLSTDYSCSLFLSTDIQGVPALLGDLADNGGATFTHALLPGSPAIDAGNPSGSGGNACKDTDQRGVTRPVDGDGDGQSVCDIGAYEYLVPAISIDDTSVAEGDSVIIPTIATFTVSLSAAYVQDISVDYATADDSATLGTDYVGVTDTLDIPAGEISATISVSITGDTLHEADETFFVNLDNAVNAALADPQGVGTILNDDDPPSLSVNDLSITEPDAGVVTATFTVTLSTASDLTITVDYATANGTATSDNDYVAVTGTLDFAPGQTSRTINVPIIGDTLFEADENFFVNLSNPANATIDDSQGAGVILNDDDCKVYLPLINKP